MDLKRIAHALFDDPARSFTVELWDRTALIGRAGGLRNKVIFRTPEALLALFPPASERRIADAFIAGDIDLQGDTIELVEAAANWSGPGRRTLLPALLAAWFRRSRLNGNDSVVAGLRGRKHSQARDRAAIRHHYDVSTDFYRLFLDKEMVYSCAYFASGDESLEAAQRTKLELICRKLGLRGGERFLDIGCGWGALILHAASRYQVNALGITLSASQLAETRRRASTTPERQQIKVSGDDYRQLGAGAAGAFDKISSIGMMEHVGSSQLVAYFQTIYRLLRPGGLFLNQAIADIQTDVRTVRWLPKSRTNFIHRYIFPDSELIPIGDVVQSAERSGFEVRDIESMREHYAQTLAAWLSRLERRFEEAVAMVGRPKARAWRLYLAGSAAGFRLGRIGVYQLLLAKRPASGRVSHLPRFRARWYEGLGQGEAHGERADRLVASGRRAP